MVERVVGLGEIDEHLPEEPWILVLGGITREGNRRARRAIRNALDADTSSLWFDGYSERAREGDAERVPLDAAIPDGHVVVVDYAANRRRRWSNRMVEGVPRALLSPLVRAEDIAAGAAAKRVPVLTRVRRALQRVLGSFRSRLLRKIGLVVQGRVCWRIVENDFAFLLEHAPPPRQVVYGDDVALTQAWHVGKSWLDAPISTEFDGP